MQKGLTLLFLSILFCIGASAQSDKKTGIIKGKFINSTTKTPFPDVRVIFPALNTFVNSEGSGEFSLTDVPYGTYSMILGGVNAKRDTVSVVVDKEIVDLGTIEVVANELNVADNAEIPTISVEESSSDDDNSNAAAQSSSSFYLPNNDDFLKSASITFGSYHYKPRGYDNSDVQINGMPIQDLETGFASFGQVGGLNDVLRNRYTTYGLKPSEYSFGTTRGTTYISATAADQRKGTNVSYYVSNRTFRNRIMATHNSGVMKNGWAYSISGSRRWAQEGYVPGTFYDAYALYGAVSKLMKNSQFNLTAMIAPTKRGGSGASTDELYDSLTDDHFYNPNWGYQNGKKRNATVSNSSQPIFIASYSYQPNQKFRWTSTLGYEFGKYRKSNIDFYNGYNPSPSYYRNLPSYYMTFNPPNTAAAAAVSQIYRNNPNLLQIQWDHLYDVNYINYEKIYNINGTTDSFFGKRSVFAVYDKVIDTRKIVFNSNFEYALAKRLTIYGGLSVTSQRDEYYKELTDLLGGDFFVNYNQFAVQTAVGNPNYNQNNVNEPNQLVKTGDRYGYDYILRILKTTVWGQGEYAIKKFKLFAAAEGGMVSFSREGMFKNGLFPENSYGKGENQNFMTVKTKGGVSYNINVKNSVFVNAGYYTDAPKVDYSYISEATRDFVVDGLKTVKTKTIELGYNLHLPKLNVRLSGYATDVTDNINNKRFYNDDPNFQTFVNYIMKGQSTRSTGFEFGANYGLTRYLNISAIAAMGQSYYTNNPNVKVYKDNSPDTAGVKREVYLKNLFLGVGPQSIYSLVFHYHPKNYLHVNLNVNYMDNNYVEVNPDRRVVDAAQGVVRDSKEWNAIYSQEKLPGAFTVDLSASKSFDVSKWYKSLHHRTLLAFNLGVINMLNNQNIKTTGFEQLRYDFTNHNPAKFPNRYIYAYGLNYYLSINLKF